MAAKCNLKIGTDGAFPATDPDMASETVGHYTIDHELGHGQNGTVYLARDMRLDRPVALKVLDRGGENAWGEALEEARLASALDHRHICTVYDVGEDETGDRSLPYIAMEYVEGRSLAETLEAGPLDRLMVLRYATQLCEALAYAHERGVAHGDVKASNVLITPDAEAKWVDFGSAVRSRRPEAISARGDVWKMGVLLYQMATGENPPADSPSGALPMPRSVPRDLAAIIRRCLDRGPDQPYGSACDILEDLRSREDRASTPATRKDASLLSRPFLFVWLGFAALLSLGAAVVLTAHLVQHPPGPSAYGWAWRGSRPVVASEPGRQTAPAGNPDAKVWVNGRSMKYHCQDSPWFGRTVAGQYLKQGDAQKAGYAPAYGTACP